jgi:hypothetical protein
MFNRDYFWLNTGTTLTSNYSGRQGQKRSQYIQFE